MLKHRGYTAHVEFDAEDMIFIGRVVGIRDGVNFDGTTVEEIEQAFKESVDNYLSACDKLGQKPEKPYSGKISLRIPINVHAAVAYAAETKGASINSFIAETLEEKIRAIG